VSEIVIIVHLFFDPLSPGRIWFLRLTPPHCHVGFRFDDLILRRYHRFI